MRYGHTPDDPIEKARASAIAALADIAQDNELLGSGTLPPVAMRVQAAVSLGTYMPHPDAVAALQRVASQSWAPMEVRMAAVASLSNR